MMTFVLSYFVSLRVCYTHAHTMRKVAKKRNGDTNVVSDASSLVIILTIIPIPKTNSLPFV